MIARLRMLARSRFNHNRRIYIVFFFSLFLCHIYVLRFRVENGHMISFGSCPSTASLSFFCERPNACLYQSIFTCRSPYLIPSAGLSNASPTVSAIFLLFFHLLARPRSLQLVLNLLASASPPRLCLSPLTMSLTARFPVITSLIVSLRSLWFGIIPALWFILSSCVRRTTYLPA